MKLKMKKRLAKSIKAIVANSGVDKNGHYIPPKVLEKSLRKRIEEGIKPLPVSLNFDKSEAIWFVKICELKNGELSVTIQLNKE